MRNMQRLINTPTSFKRIREREKQKELQRVERIRSRPYERDEILIH